MKMLKNKDELLRIQSDAYIQIDMANAIAEECNRDQAWLPYVREKLDVLKRSVEFVDNLVRMYEEMEE